MIRQYSFKLMLFSLLLLAACSKNPYEKYPGLWEQQDTKHHEIIEITQQGDAFLLNNAVLNANTKNNFDGGLMVLAKVEGQLSFNTGFGNVFLVLSDDNTLRIANESFKRISSTRVEEIKAVLALQEQERLNARQQALEKQEQERLAQEARMRERAEERAKCQELLDKINVELASIKQYGSNNAKWTAEYEKIKQKYTEIAKQYTNCKPDFF